MGFGSILVVDDDDSMRHVLALILREHGYEVRAVASGEEALVDLESHEVGAVLTDVRMARMDGIELTRRLHRERPELTVIVMSAYGTHDSAIEAMKAGAYDYVSKPFKPDEVVLVLRKAEERERLKRENVRLRGELAKDAGVDRLVGDSEPIRELARQIRKIAPVKSTVLIVGESGTGKELVARALHALSPRAAMPFVAVNCGAIPEALIESELFGHVRGAFTDAVRSKQGLFTEADGGTLLLDEVGELPLGLQVKLLRVLQEEEVRRVGDNRSERIDVRVLAATARDLGAAATKGMFREDLYYRLNVLTLEVPPLRQRLQDLDLLVAHFVARFNTRLGRRPPVRGLTPEAAERLAGYAWPGNVRELENAIERAMVLAEGERVGVEDLPDRLTAVAAPPAEVLADLSVKVATRRLEEDHIRRALRRTRGNRTRAAQLLELSHRALLYKIKEYGIDPDAEGERGEEPR